MKNTVLFILIIFLGSVVGSSAQDITGKWKTIDDKTGKEKSIVEITVENGVYSGKIIDLANPERKNWVCDKCPGDNKGKPLLGLTIIKGLKKKGKEYKGGEILDPESGKEYKCSIKPQGDDKLDVRGYIGISLIGRSQTWIKSN